MKKFRYLLFLFILLFAFPTTAHAAFTQKAPTVKIRRSNSSVTLSWNKLTGATGYQIFQTNASGNSGKCVRTVKKTSASLNVQRGRTYYFCVRAVQKKNGKTKYGAFSKVVSMRVIAESSVSTIKKLLQTALQPVGSTMYIWGGGWDIPPFIGVNPAWKSFFNRQSSSYNHNYYDYQATLGLDCSGYVGWCIYNILNTKNGQPGYVMYAREMAQNFASRGWGSYKSNYNVTDYRAGDIMSSSGHVYIVVGQCSDGSVVLLHSSPPGVQLCGTPSRYGSMNSKAIQLATKYMKKYYPAWYKKFPVCSRDMSYLRNFGQMRWDVTGNAIMTDPEKYQKKNASQILRDLFS